MTWAPNSQRLNAAITRELADGPRPSWNKGDFFAAKFAKGH